MKQIHFFVQCSEFVITICLKKINILGQEVSSTPSMFIGDYTLKAVEDFSYLGSVISSNLSLDTELNKRIGQAAAVLSLLRKKIWDNTMLTISNKMKVYQACVLSTLLYIVARPGPSTPTKSADSTLSTALLQKDFRNHLARLCPQQGCRSTGGIT